MGLIRTYKTTLTTVNCLKFRNLRGVFISSVIDKIVMKNFSSTWFICNILHSYKTFVGFLFITFFVFSAAFAQDYQEISGTVSDANNGDELVFADITIENTNIRTVSNAEGEYLLKIPNEYLSNKIVFSFLGYQEKQFTLEQLKSMNGNVSLPTLVTELGEVSLSIPKDAKTLVRESLKRKGNYLDQNTLMTAFYRETIKKRRQNASLAEAVVEIYKEPYNTNRNDAVRLIKSRKNTNYSKLDTIALKLQGGPFNTIYSDLIKYPEFVFSTENIDNYNFKFLPSTQINDRRVYVVQFEQRPEIVTPLYYGKLYIDAQTYALTSAVYNLNVEDEDLAAELFVQKKPRRVSVYPTEASYRVDYKTKDGKWYYGYSNILLTFKVDWKGKLFNSVYTLQSEMVITDWDFNTSDKKIEAGERLRPSVILTDEASGFADPDFWGEYNIIEPEKSIEQAIKKINRQLLRS